MLPIPSLLSGRTPARKNLLDPHRIYGRPLRSPLGAFLDPRPATQSPSLATRRIPGLQIASEHRLPKGLGAAPSSTGIVYVYRRAIQWCLQLDGRTRILRGPHCTPSWLAKRRPLPKGETGGRKVVRVQWTNRRTPQRDAETRQRTARASPIRPAHDASERTADQPNVRSAVVPGGWMRCPLRKFLPEHISRFLRFAQPAGWPIYYY